MTKHPPTATSGQPQPDANSSLDAGLNEGAATPAKKAAKPSLPIMDMTDESDGMGFMLIGVTGARSKKPTPKS